MKKINLLYFLLAVTIFLGCKTSRKVDRNKTEYKSEKIITVRDTVFKEKIITKEIIKTDTVIKKVFDFSLSGKPKYDSINKRWLPFVFDYTVYNGKDSTRHKGSFSGDFDSKGGFDWEKAYYNLKAKTDQKETEKKGSSESILQSEEFKENSKKVQSEGFAIEMMIYTVLGTAVIFYFLGLFSPKIWRKIKDYYLGGKIRNFFK